MVLLRKRAKEERLFDFLRNDFGWKYPPFSKMEYNTVFYLISMISYVIYKYIINEFSKCTDKLDATMRRQTFATIFITVAAQIFSHGNNFEMEFHGEEFNIKDYLPIKK